MSDIDTVVVDSLKALDLERPIKEADITYVSKFKEKDRRKAVFLLRERAKRASRLTSPEGWRYNQSVR